ncbi:hypothetical protein EV13_0230 [Prochlorococcus sp. MIT 0702]|nr:hypothetical protein EV12_1841 [Prochlorococcus sp. MIT 0701]KGG30467.1 hypothetical protein EV13_0230 [Prochlorococcus sp. MIT 0702]KGG33995.1 hypothetical protein EV14_1535 [Prochlorococcus sp. MIT 0703]
MVSLYLKGHSYGEFVFDQAFARLAGDLGLGLLTKTSWHESCEPCTGLSLFCVAIRFSAAMF